jgi:hypothetical protein
MKYTMPQTLLEKLCIKSGSRIAIINMPVPRPGLPDPFPNDVTVVSDLYGQFHQVYLFVTKKAILDKLAFSAIEALAFDGLLWVCYPKGTSGMQSDLTRDKGWGSLRGCQCVS